MERKKHILITGLLIWSVVLMASDFKTMIYQSYLSGNMKTWKQVLEKMQPQPNESGEAVLERLNAQYGYIGWCISMNKFDEARFWMKKMEENMILLDKRKFQPATILSYRASFMGYRIGLNRIQAPFLGPKSMDYAKASMQTDPQNPWGFLQYANIEYYCPPMFGGSKESALKYYLLTQKKMESIQHFTHENWNYISLLTKIAKTYYELGNKDKAIIYLKKTLQIAPEYQWVKNELLPKYTKND